jgi:hypothetical protein
LANFEIGVTPRLLNFTANRLIYIRQDASFQPKMHDKIRVMRTLSPRLLCSEPMRRCTLDDCHGACCVYGVWVDTREAENILKHAELIIPHIPSGATDPAGWFNSRQEADKFSASGQVVHSRVVPDESQYSGTACIFLRKDYKCALQVAADSNGYHPWHFKPFYCILHPLDLDKQGQVTLDETQALLAEKGSCLRPAEHPVTLLEIFEPELRYLMGEDAYREAQSSVIKR